MDKLAEMDMKIDFEFYRVYSLFYKETINFDDENFKIKMNSMIHILNQLGLYHDRYLIKDVKDDIPYNPRVDRLCHHMKSSFKKLDYEELKFLNDLEITSPTFDEELVSKVGDILVDISHEANIDKYDLVLDISKKLMSNDKEYTIDILLDAIGITDFNNLDDIKTKIKKYQRKKTIEEVNLSSEFHSVCDRYGFDFLNFNLIDNYIVIKTIHDDLYAIMDYNYNIINITKLDGKDFENQIKQSFIELNEYNLEYPLNDINLSDIIEIGNSNIESSDELDNQIISYIRFMNKEAKWYHKNLLALQSVGLKLPLVTEYLSSVQKNMQNYVKCRKEINISTESNDILEFLGQKAESHIDYNDIENIIKFIYSEHDKSAVESSVRRIKNKSLNQKVKTI